MPVLCSNVPFRMTLSDLLWFSEILTYTEHSTASLWQLSFLYTLRFHVTTSTIRTTYKQRTNRTYTYSGLTCTLQLVVDHVCERLVIKLLGGRFHHRSYTLVTLYRHIKTVEQRTIIQQYGDWYTGHWLLLHLIQRGGAPNVQRTVPIIIAHPSTASVAVYQLHIIRCGTIITLALRRVKTL